MKLNTLLVCLILVSSCTNYKLQHTYSSKEATAQAALDCINKADVNCINEVLLNREEHNTMFWNHVGEKFTSDPGMTPDFAYDNMAMETKISWKELTRDFKDKEPKIQSMKCTREPEEYGPFTLHLGCHIIVKLNNGDTVKTTAIRTYLEYKKQFKLYHLRRE